MGKAVAALFAILASAVALYGWGPEGHRIVADIAQKHLTEVAKSNVRLLIGDYTLASVANWADDVRPDRDETYGWHFVDIPKGEQGFSEERDCYRPPGTHNGAMDDHQNCVVDRIEYFKHVLGDRNASRCDHVEALKFIVHFVGDIHQPFHSIGEAKGGNDIHVTEFGSKRCGPYECNLHSAWDSGLIEHTGMGEQAYVAHLDRLISEEHLSASGNPTDWANESFALAKAAWVDDGGSVDEQYYRQQIKVVDERLALAGLRLAALLNEVFGQVPPMPKEQLDCVRAGEVKNFDVELEEFRAFSGGRLQLLIGFSEEEQSPDHPWCEKNLCASSTVDVVPGKTNYAMSIRIPGEAKSGTWAAFIGYALPNGDFTDITPKKHVRFKVVDNLDRLCPEMKNKPAKQSFPCVKVTRFASVP